MKYVTGLLFAGVTLSIQTAHTQTKVGFDVSLDAVNIGVKSGTTGLDALNSRMVYPNLSVVVEQEIAQDVSIMTGIGTRSKGFEIRQQTETSILGLSVPFGAAVETKLNYIHVPLMLKYEYEMGGRLQPFISGGPSLLYGTRGSIQTKATALIDFNVTNTNIDFSDNNYNRWGADLNANIGVNYVMNYTSDLNISLGYQKGLTDIVNDLPIDLGSKSQAWNLSVGYRMKM